MAVFRQSMFVEGRGLYSGLYLYTQNLFAEGSILNSDLVYSLLLR